MWLVIAIPSPQGAVAIVAEQGLQPRVFHVTIAKRDLGLSLMPSIRPAGATRWVILTQASTPPQTTASAMNRLFPTNPSPMAIISGGLAI